MPCSLLIATLISVQTVAGFSYVSVGFKKVSEKNTILVKQFRFKVLMPFTAKKY